MSFPTTQWTLLAEATLGGDPVGQTALTRMCEAYRRPIENYLVYRGCKPHEIDDIVQDFFVGWLKSRAWKRADKVRGRFRNFVLGGVMHALAKHYSRYHAQKRGGGRETDSLDVLLESGLEPMSEVHEDIVEFDRRWAVTLVENTMAAVAREEHARGRAEEFAVLSHFLPGVREMISFEVAAKRLGSNVNAVKAAVFRLRVRFRERLRAAVARTVSAPHEIEEELLYLRSLLMAQPKSGTSSPINGNRP